MAELIFARVMQILRDTPASRDSDDVLIFEYTARHCKMTLNLALFGTSHNELRTINRARQKIQKAYPTLGPALRVAAHRHKQAEDWRERYG